jgi:glyoxylase-like metal-dependent hydrolase (beta-lactamase superfamily II)
MTQIAPGVYSMKQNKGGHVHAFLLDNGTDLTLIDTLFDTDARQILKRIESIGHTIQDLKHIVLTPGHTPGHLAVWWPERRILFAGDAIATYPVFEAGWPAFNLNPTQQRISIRRMADLEAEVVAVGHGDPITGGAAERLRSLV